MLIDFLVIGLYLRLDLFVKPKMELIFEAFPEELIIDFVLFGQFHDEFDLVVLDLFLVASQVVAAF